MATNRKLPDSDVRSIFESLIFNRSPPADLPFQIVPVGSEGQPLSPPPFAFEDGLYVLLRPEKKTKKKRNMHQQQPPRIPPNLMHCLVSQPPPAFAASGWRLSGPQNEKGSAIQQRYCYAEGADEYCLRKGATMYTMYVDGQEDKEFRLLYVYYSAKRAANKGLKVRVAEEEPVGPPAPKRARSAKVTKDYNVAVSPPSVASTKCLSFDLSTTSFEPNEGAASDPLSPIFSPHHESTICNTASSFVTPIRGVFDKMNPVCDYSASTPPLLSPMRNQSRHSQSAAWPPSNYEASMFNDDVVGFGNNRTPQHVTPHPSHVSDFSKKTPQWLSPSLCAGDDASRDMIDSRHRDWEPCDFDMDADLLDFDDFVWKDLLPTGDNDSDDTASQTSHGDPESFQKRLSVLHESFKEKIFLAKKPEQAQLLTMLSSWAKQIAQEPLGKVDCGASHSPCR